ncbi:MAG TPA: hypothetical protein VMB23_05375, partial [Spirochaetia bacterium]|nr:hypothetical protein [Spirochaetia bacterium]
MRWGAGALVLLALSACASAPGPRTLGVAPTPTTPVRSDSYPVPSPSWPLRQGELPPTVGIPIPTAPAVWKDPSSPVALPTAAVATLVPAPGPDLPLPAVVPLPLKLTPVSRSWTRVAQAKTETVLPAPPAPVAATPAPSPTPVKTSDPKAKADTKAPATVAATPQPKPTPKPTSPPTPASTATILPTDTKTTGSDFQWEDVNAVAGDAVTLHFDKTNWLYLDTPTQQKAVGFQSINRDKDATTFQFRPLVPGQYTLEFQRQDLVNQSTEARKVRLAVVPAGTRTSSTGTVLSPQTSTVPANDALEMARQLAASGKTSEAVQKLLQTYRADDARTNLELARLLDQDGQDDQALTYLDKNLTLTGPDFQGTLELGTKLAA